MTVGVEVCVVRLPLPKTPVIKGKSLVYNQHEK